MKRIIAIIAATVALTLGPIASRPAVAAAQPYCDGTLIQQWDMTGRWSAVDGPVVLNVFPCGGTTMYWRDEGGAWRGAGYTTSSTLQGGGYTATIYLADPVAGTPWGTRTITYKPAEPGYVQLIFWVPWQGQFHLYRLIRVGDAA